MAFTSATASAAVLKPPFFDAKRAFAHAAIFGKPAAKKSWIPAFKSDAEFIKLDGSPIVSLETSRPRRSATISASAHRRQARLFGSGMNSSGIKGAFRTRGGTNIPAPAPGPEKKSGGDPPQLNIPPWAKWVLDVVYKRIRPLEDELEKTAEEAIEVVETVAEATEKIASEVGDAFSGNENVKEAAAKIKAAAAMIDEDAHKAQNLIQKVDEIKEEVDSVVESFIGNGEAMEKEMEAETNKKANKKPK